MLKTMAVEDSADVFCIAEELERTLSRALWHNSQPQPEKSDDQRIGKIVYGWQGKKDASRAVAVIENRLLSTDRLQQNGRRYRMPS
jgi:hypothetical protein